MIEKCLRLKLPMFKWDEFWEWWGDNIGEYASYELMEHKSHFVMIIRIDYGTEEENKEKELLLTLTW